MKLNFNSIIVIFMAIIVLGVIVVAVAGLFAWFIDHFWVILLSGAVIFALALWIGKSDRIDHIDGPL